jgi:hypothetical protein
LRLDNFLYTSNDSVLNTSVIPASDTNILWSPYNHYSGNGYQQILSEGGYVKVSFSGQYLGLEVDTSNLNAIPANSIIVHTYLDGATTPLINTLADMDGNNQVLISNALTTGTHNATIYLSKTTPSNNRWTNNAPNTLRISGIVLEEDGLLLPIPSSSKNLIFYGDSITEGYSGIPQGAEYSYAGRLGNMLENVEYGQVGYSGIGRQRN